MTDPDEPQHRAYHQPDPDRIEVRETREDEDGVFVVRMPIASTGEVRNQGDDPLDRNEIAGMARQIEERAIGVFLDHGRNRKVGGSRYSAAGKVGEWQNPEVIQAQGEEAADLLEAEARMMDPDTLPEAVGSVREALAALKAQVDRDFSLASSIGWREDDSSPGGNDLMEASIVGIGADPRTTSDSSPAEAMARAALAERGDDVDAERLVEEFRAVVMGPDTEDREVRDTVSDNDPEASDSGEEQDATTEEETEQSMDAEEFRAQMLEMQQQQSETLQAVNETLRSLRADDGDDEEDEEDDEDDDGDDDGEQSSDDPDDTQSSDGPDLAEREIEIDGEHRSADEVVSEHREALSALQAGGIDLEDVDFGEQEVAVDEEEAEEQASERDEQTDDERDSDASTGATSGWLDT